MGNAVFRPVEMVLTKRSSYVGQPEEHHRHSPVSGHPSQDRTGQGRAGQDRTGQDRTGQDRTRQRLASYLRLRVELCAEERLGLVSDTFIGAIVNVREQRLPPRAELGVVDGEAVVLRGDVALVRQAVHHRLENEGHAWRGWGGSRRRRLRG